MEEIAETFKELSLTESSFYRAADVYRLVKETSLDKKTPEEWADEASTEQFRERYLRDIISIISQEDISNNL
ncbi:hypothetical protein QUB80_25175 [Chlorogloeopsis sp. ULAP01]|uniref:hypothetical protein n=1 Tax=Chlorogloeopsis sp. ULAP01 TaxID=3056483 RepID=UPI0025AB0095|nr:hypothetical protein [Chlorogloeopsis sp. ULAP01]MDM9383976.1 hypothetical protein [Chlorogloeopsis sp. ULAP01]